MSEEILNNDVAETPIVAEEVVATETTAPVTEDAAKLPERESRGRRAPARGGRNSRGPKPVREKPEFDSKAIDVRRVTRVVSGGRRFSLHVTMVAGDRNGRVGLGTGKAVDTQAAMDKALKSAKKNMIKFKMGDKKTIKHEVNAKYDTAEVWIAPNKGKGLIAGSSARIILDLAGLQNVTAKFHGGTKNKLNNARATMKALAQVASKA
jgi:small subunit ribosomal protein S5